MSLIPDLGFFYFGLVVVAELELLLLSLLLVVILLVLRCAMIMPEILS